VPEGAFLGQAHLSGANLSGTDLSGADLRDADLSGADLRNADLSGADLMTTGFGSVVLKGADLRGAELRGLTTRDTVYDVHTRWPDGFVPAKHGAVLVRSSTMNTSRMADDWGPCCESGSGDFRPAIAGV
jgi:hypothetical protein